ncbi:MAG TPA: LysR substrate-binding domain-containing protein [Tepidisphaeraceae bacterium]|nr:LysR substrate-binding domain-containing protein [Tepidisphaeraceae bacterium]
MELNRNHLAVFHAVARAGGFSRAADALMVSQPAVSLQVAELERALGMKLFDRLPRGVRLTEAGRVLSDHAARIAAIEQEARSAMLELKGLKRGRLSVGASQTIGVYLLPEVFGAFSRRHPDVKLDLEIANTDIVQKKLGDGLFDLALTEGFIESEDLEAAVFRQDELVPIAPPEHALLKRRGRGKPVTAAELCREPLILRETGSGTRAVVEHHLAKLGLSIRPIMSLGSTEAVKRAVASGIGLAIVSRLALETELNAGALAIVPVSDLKIRRPLHRLELRGKERSAATKAFLATLAGS